MSSRWPPAPASIHSPYATKLAPVVADGRLLVTGDSIIDALKAEDGSPLWKALLAAPAAFAPVARGGWVFVALTDGAVAGLRADTGVAVWRAAIGQPAAPPVVEGDRLYAAATGGALQALSVTDGTPVWRATLDGDATAMAAVAGHVFVATSGRWLYDIDAGRGHVRWRFRIQGAAIGLAVDEDRVVAVTLDQAVRAFKIGSGAQVWRQELAFRPAGGPVITGASVLVTGFAPTVRAIDRRTGDNQGLYKVPLPTDAGGISLETLSAGPVLAERATLFDDMLVLVTQHGLLHGAKRAFDPAGLARHRAAGNARAGTGAAAGDARGCPAGPDWLSSNPTRDDAAHDAGQPRRHTDAEAAGSITAASGRGRHGILQESAIPADGPPDPEPMRDTTSEAPTETAAGRRVGRAARLIVAGLLIAAGIAARAAGWWRGGSATTPPSGPASSPTPAGTSPTSSPICSAWPRRWRGSRTCGPACVTSSSRRGACSRPSTRCSIRRRTDPP